MPSPSKAALVATARAMGATVIDTPGSLVIVVPDPMGANPDELLPLAEASRTAATSMRVIRDAIRSGALPAVGRQRDRAVRRRDLDSWIETRRAPVANVTEGQAERVERRMARKRRSAA